MTQLEVGLEDKVLTQRTKDPFLRGTQDTQDPGPHRGVPQPCEQGSSALFSRLLT